MTKALEMIGARQALRLALIAGLLLVLAANLPGHLSYDSVAQLYEGHFHVRETWGPAIYAWLLGVFDAVIPGTSLYVVASCALFFGSLWGLATLRGHISWLGVAAAVLIALTPQVLIYQGIVWKDVAFANTAVGGAVCLALALSGWRQPARRWGWLAASLVLFAVSALVRQNGGLIPAVCAIAVGWVAGRGSWRRGAAWAAGWIAALLVTMKVLGVVCVPTLNAPDIAVKEGVRIVQNYDLIGAITLEPSYRLTYIEQAAPKDAAVIRERGPRGWSPDRVDWLDRDPTIGPALLDVPNKVAMRQWLDLIFRHPALYLRVRWQDFRWVFLTPQIDRCLPVYTGVDAVQAKMVPLGIPHRYSTADNQLGNYDTWFLDTPAHLHWAYAIVALAVGAVLLRRRQPADLAVAGLMFGALAVTASFFIISIACDYRYLYVLDLSALVGLLYVALDPSGLVRRT